MSPCVIPLQMPLYLLVSMKQRDTAEHRGIGQSLQLLDSGQKTFFLSSPRQNDPRHVSAGHPVKWSPLAGYGDRHSQPFIDAAVVWCAEGGFRYENFSQYGCNRGRSDPRST